jgi:predicted nucleic acid-binding protein
VAYFQPLKLVKKSLLRVGALRLLVSLRLLRLGPRLIGSASKISRSEAQKRFPNVRPKELKPQLATEVLDGIELFVAESQILNIEYATLQMSAQWLNNFSLGLLAGDALHVALCKMNDIPLATTDRQLIRAVKKLQVKCLAL